MLLTIDAGNTRTKWAVFNADGVSLHQGACLNAVLDKAIFAGLDSCFERVIISNVAGQKHADMLIECLSHIALPIHWVKSTLNACGLTNGYLFPNTLGSDRWAALIASWQIHQKSCVVVNAGTAITIDALCSNTNGNNADFIGGIILPGLNLMQQSLGLGTAQLPRYDRELEAKQDDIQIFAKNTVDAIYFGATHAVIGAIKLMTDALQLQTKTIPHIILSGGNAQTIHHHLLAQVTNPIIIVDNLVLQGLFLIEKSMQSKSS